MSLIRIENLTFAYPGSFDNVFKNANIQIDTDWKLGFVGRNGRGKTTLMRILMGEFENEYEGRVISSVSFDYFPYNEEGVSELDEQFERLPDGHEAKRSYYLGFRQAQSEARPNIVISLLKLN